MVWGGVADNDNTKQSSSFPISLTFLAVQIPFFTSKRRAADPGSGRASKVVPARNLYKMVDDMMGSFFASFWEWKRNNGMKIETQRFKNQGSDCSL